MDGPTKIRGKYCYVEWSGRGYVTVKYKNEIVTRDMTHETKTRLSEKPDQWVQEMERLESLAIQRMREVLKGA